MAHFLGLDIGTSSTKAIVIDPSGAILGEASTDHPISQPQPGWSEQDPRDWWDSAVTSIRTVLDAPGLDADSVAAVGLSGQMHGSVLLGQDAASSGGAADPLCPALLWNDQRTDAECREIEEAFGGRAATVGAVGNAALTGFTLPKLLWLRRHRRETWSAARHVLLPKDFVAFRLTGALGTDVGDASGTLLFDVTRRTWSADALERLDLDPALLPVARESAAVTGAVGHAAAAATGLREGTPVAAGSGDNMTAAIGAGVSAPGVVLAVLGTSGVVLAHSAEPRTDLARPETTGRLHTMCAATGADGWCLTGCMLSAAGALDWARRTIAPDVEFDVLLEEAAAVEPGSEGLVFLPYLTGERCPHPDPQARGAWIGMTSRHGRGHLMRSVIEGVTFGMASMLDLVRELGVPVEVVRLSGGGNRSIFWRRLQADLYGCPVVTTTAETGGSALGGAVLGAVAAGAYSSVSEACATIVRVAERLDPGDTLHPRLAEARTIHGGLYDTLRPTFRALAFPAPTS